LDSIENLCMNCMTYGSGDGVCGNCGKNTKTYSAEPHQLPPRTVLNGKYLIGRVIGEGGFGITYVGWDTSLSLKVAVKEFYPNGFVSRNSTVSTTVHSFGGEKAEFVEKSRDSFIKEAQRLAKFFGLPGIVAVKDFFEENGTAYIVMEFVEGATLKTVLANMGGRMPEAHVLEMMKPLVRSLASIHQAGLIHRDIAPDNIMVQPDGSVKMIDFGATREFSGENSMTVLLKHGYAPEEQYDTNRARQGPWTDVYALCATIYRAIDGNNPPDAIARLRRDKFTGFQVSVSENTRRVVMKGLAVAPEDRWQDIEELARELYGEATQSLPSSSPSPRQNQTQGNVCSSCGFQIPAGDAFCKKCGAKNEPPSPPQRPEPYPKRDSQQPVSPMRSPQMPVSHEAVPHEAAPPESTLREPQQLRDMRIIGAFAVFVALFCNLLMLIKGYVVVLGTVIEIIAIGAYVAALFNIRKNSPLRQRVLGTASAVFLLCCGLRGLLNIVTYMLSSYFNFPSAAFLLLYFLYHVSLIAPTFAMLYLIHLTVKNAGAEEKRASRSAVIGGAIVAAVMILIYFVWFW